MRYHELKAINQKRINDLPIHFAFGQGKFEAKLAELGVTIDDVGSLPAGGFMLKKDTHLFVEAMKVCQKDEEEFLADDDNLIDALEYELANHEYCITYDASDALDVLGLKFDERVQRLLPKAIDNYMASVV